MFADVFTLLRVEGLNSFLSASAETLLSTNQNDTDLDED